MEQELKRKSLLKLFSCYPVAMLADQDAATMMVGAYLEKLETVSADAVESACRMLSSKPEQFPPSAGVLSDKAREIEFKRAKADADSVPRLPYVHAADEGSPEERAERKRKVAELVADFKRAKVLH